MQSGARYGGRNAGASRADATPRTDTMKRSTSTATTADPGATGTGRDSDVVLLERIRAGHHEAWDLLIDRYQRLVYSVAVRNGLGPEDAIDVTQATFTILLESSGALRDGERLASWLMTVARRQSWRVRQRRRREVLSAEVDPGVGADALDWDELATLHGALDQLGSPCRELLHALYLDADEPTYAQVARRLGRSVGGIGPLRGRCLARLATLLEDDA